MQSGSNTIKLNIYHLSAHGTLLEVTIGGDVDNINNV